MYLLSAKGRADNHVKQKCTLAQHCCYQRDETPIAAAVTQSSIYISLIEKKKYKRDRELKKGGMIREEPRRRKAYSEVGEAFLPWDVLLCTWKCLPGHSPGTAHSPPHLRYSHAG